MHQSHRRRIGLDADRRVRWRQRRHRHARTRARARRAEPRPGLGRDGAGDGRFALARRRTLPRRRLARSQRQARRDLRAAPGQDEPGARPRRRRCKDHLRKRRRREVVADAVEARSVPPDHALEEMESARSLARPFSDAARRGRFRRAQSLDRVRARALRQQRPPLWRAGVHAERRPRFALRRSVRPPQERTRRAAHGRRERWAPVPARWRA